MTERNSKEKGKILGASALKDDGMLHMMRIFDTCQFKEMATILISKDIGMILPKSKGGKIGE